MVDEFLQQGHVALLHSLLEHEREGSVVDVLRSETKVYELLVGIQTADGIKLFLDEIFDSLHVVVCDALYLLDAVAIGLGEVLIQSSERSKMLVGESGQLRQRQLAKADEVFYLYANSVLHQGVF